MLQTVSLLFFEPLQHLYESVACLILAETRPQIGWWLLVKITLEHDDPQALK